MAIFLQADLPGVTTDQYDALHAKLDAMPGNPFEGCLAHVAVPTDLGLQIFDLWESEEALQKFMRIVMPASEDVGIPQGSPPKIMQVHSHWVPGA